MIRINTNAKLFFGLFFSVVAAQFTFGNASVSASCGVSSGSTHEYAGLIVNVRWVDSGGTVHYDDKDATVLVRPSGGAGASDGEGGNIVLLASDGVTVLDRKKSLEFRQSTGCDWGNTGGVKGDSTNINILGDGTTGSPDVPSGRRTWGLDCDTSKLGSGNYQRFDVIGMTKPSAARAGGYWDNATSADAVDPPNGQTRHVYVTYHEPPPPNQTPEGDINQVTCTTIRLRAYDRDPTRRTSFRVKRINSSGNGTTDVIGPTVHNPASGTWTDYVTYPADLRNAFSVYSPITFILEAQDIETGNWSQVDREAYPSNPNPCQNNNLPVHGYFNPAMACQGQPSSSGYNVRAEDYNRPGAGVYYRIINVSTGVQVDFGATSINDGTFHSLGMSVGQTYKAQVLDADIAPNGQWVDIDSPKTISSIPCGGNRPDYDIVVSCEGLTFNNVQPVDPSGVSVRIKWFTDSNYPNYRPSTYSPLESDYHDIGDQYDSYMTIPPGGGFVPWPQQYEDNNNDGWAAWVGDYGAASGGHPSLAWHYSANLYGHCYDASCSINIDSNVDGAPPNSVKAGSQVNAHATVTNNGNSAGYAIFHHAEYRQFNYGFSGDSTNWQNEGYNSISRSPLNINHPSGRGRLALNVDGTPQYINAAIPPNGSSTVDFTFTARNTVQTYNISAYPDYYGLYGIGPTCTGTVSVYQPFKFTSNPTQPPDLENPEKLNYSATVTQETGYYTSNPPVQYYSGYVPNTVYPTMFKYTYIPGASCAPTPELCYSPPEFQVSYSNSGNTYTGTWTDTYTGDPDSRYFNKTNGGNRDHWAIGDQFCYKMYIDYRDGWIGPGNQIYETNRMPGANESQKCGNVIDEPFTRSYLGDVVSGGNFEPSSGGGNGNIYGFNKDFENDPIYNLPNKGAAGSGVEFAALALGTVQGYTSASLRGAAPISAGGLTYGNNGGLGGYNPGGRTIYNYYDRTRDPNLAGPTPSSNLAVGSASGSATKFTDKSQTWISQSGGSPVTVSVNGGTFAGQHAYYIDGDVTINTDIKYATDSGSNWSASDKIPSLALIVKGNIYITGNVSELDGLFIAQPKSGVANSGKIYTCSTGSGYPSDSMLKTTCRNQLTVYGAFVAGQVKLFRTNNTISNTPVQSFGSSSSSRMYQKQDISTPLAAERFILSPDYFLGRPYFYNTTEGVGRGYDSIKSLAPIL